MSAETARALFDTCCGLSDRISGLLHQVAPIAVVTLERRSLLALQDCQAHLAAAEQLLAMVREWGRP